MFEHRNSVTHFDLKPNYDQLSLVMAKAISNNIPLPVSFTAQNTLNFPALHHDLYKLALEGPYGQLIRQIFDGIFQLVVMHQTLLLITQKIQTLKDELHEKAVARYTEQLDEKSDLPLLAEMTESQEQIKQLEDQQSQLTRALPHYQNQILYRNRLYVSAIDKLLTSVAHQVLLNRANELHYDFNEAEKQLLKNPIPRARIEEVLTASYAAQHNEFKKDMPKTEDLASRSLHDLELHTLMVLNTYRNRKLAEMTEASTNNETTATSTTDSNHNNGSTAHSVTDALKKSQEKYNVQTALRAEFDAMYQQQSKQSNKEPVVNKKDDLRARFSRQKTDEMIPKNSVLGALKLLKQFKATFVSLDDQVQALHALHKKDLSPDNMYEEMQKHIENAHKKLNIKSSQQVTEPHQTATPRNS
jgi:hypothetical protein